MLVDSKTEGQLKITLSAVEVCDWFGSFNDIRYDSQKGRRALSAILLTAMESSDFRLNKERLFIKVFPTETGGCDIFFTLAHAKRLHRTERCYIYEFACCEDMLSALEEVMSSTHKDTPVSVYGNKGKYRIFLNAGQLSKKVALMLAEYASLVHKSPLIKEKTQEYWQKICESTPVNKIILK